MSENLIITISRSAGSGGHIIADRLGKKLNINCYDKELIARAAKDSGLAEEIFNSHDEKATSSFLYSLVFNTYGYGTTYADVPLNQKVFMAQFDTIKKLAKEESCIIVGRCADYALSDYSKKLSVFIFADEESAKQRVMDTYNLNETKALDMINKKNKERASYYNYYTSKRWGDAKNYDISINSATLGLDGTVDALYDIVMKLK